MIPRIVVPTATLEHHLRNQFAREGLVFRPDMVLTLSHFAGKFTEDVPEVSGAAFYLMVEQAVERARRPEFARVAEMPGFHALVARTLQELDTAGCDVEALVPMNAALAMVWRDVQAEMHRRGVATRATRLKIAAERVKVQGTVEFRGFAAFSDPELRFVEACGARTHVDVGREGGIPGPCVHMSVDAAPRSACATLLAPENIEREADEIARRILVESQNGVPFREIGIVIRNREVYEPILRANLERFGIPARFYFDAPLHEHPVTRFITGLVDAKLSGWEHERTLAALRLAPKTGVSAAMDRLDIALREQLPNRSLEKLMDLAASDPLVRDLIANCGDGVRGCPDPRDLFRPGKLHDEVPWRTVEIYREQAEALSAIERAIAEAQAWHSSPVSFATLWRTVKTILRLTPLRVPDQRRNVVHVLTAWEARQWDLPVIFVCGLVEGQFPKRHSENLFLSDAAIRKFQDAGIRLRTSEDRNAEEALLFEAVASRATASLYLSYPRTEARGEPNIRSVLIADVEADEPCMRVQPAPLPAPDKWKPPSAIAHADLLPILATRHASLSATALESYLQCPFQFFATKTLKLREFPARPNARLDFLTMGSIVHKVLAEWFVDRPPLEPLFERVFREFCVEKRVPPGYRTEMMRHRMFQDVERFCNRDTWPRGAAVETESEFKFDLIDSISINGRIDRLERQADGSAVVVDYKYSNANNARKLIEDETRLQAPIYLLALERFYGLRPAAMVYYSLREKLETSGRGTVPGLEKSLKPLTRNWLEDAEAKITASVRLLREGRIHPAPANTEPCRYCDVKDVCRYEAAAVLTASGEAAGE